MLSMLCGPEVSFCCCFLWVVHFLLYCLKCSKFRVLSCWQSLKYPRMCISCLWGTILVVLISVGRHILIVSRTKLWAEDCRWQKGHHQQHIHIPSLFSLWVPAASNDGSFNFLIGMDSILSTMSQKKSCFLKFFSLEYFITVTKIIIHWGPKSIHSYLVSMLHKSANG